jgi:hypothetical protein
MGVLRPLEGFTRMLQCLFGMLMSGLMIFFSVLYGSGTVRVCGQLMELSRSSVRVTRHSVFPSSMSHVS